MEDRGAGMEWRVTIELSGADGTMQIQEVARIQLFRGRRHLAPANQSRRRGKGRDEVDVTCGVELAIFLASTPTHNSTRNPSSRSEIWLS
jgi:hypothetical protein